MKIRSTFDICQPHTLLVVGLNTENNKTQQRQNSFANN